MPLIFRIVALLYQQMKLILKYSLLASLLVITVKLAVYFTHTQFTQFGIYSGLLSLLLLIFPLFIAVKEKRDKELNGFIPLKEAIKTGLGIAVISGLTISTFTFLYYTFIDRETLTVLIKKSEAFMQQQKKSQSEIDLQITALKEFYSPLRQATGALTGILTSSLILSFIFSTFLVRNPPVSEN